MIDPTPAFASYRFICCVSIANLAIVSVNLFEPTLSSRLLQRTFFRATIVTSRVTSIPFHIKLLSFYVALQPVRLSNKEILPRFSKASNSNQ